MKRFLMTLLAVLLLCGMLLCTFVACNGGNSGDGAPNTPNNPNTPNDPDGGAPVNKSHFVYLLVDWDLEDELARFKIDENGRIVSRELIYSGDLEIEHTITYNYDGTGKLISLTFSEDGEQQTYPLTYTDAASATVEGEINYTFHQNGTIATETYVEGEGSHMQIGFTKDGLPAFVEIVDGEDRMELAVTTTVGTQSICEGEQIEDGESIGVRATFVQNAAGALASFLIEADEGADDKWSYLFEYTYHGNGILKQCKSTAKVNGVLDSIDVENYNEAGQLYEEYYYRYDEEDNGAPERTDRTEHTYDAQGRKILEKVYCIYPDGREELDQTYEIEYHENGNRKKTIWSQYHNGSCIKEIKEYDENGNQINDKYTENY